MTRISDQQRIANFVGALSQLLCGKPGRGAEFIRKVHVVVSGAEPDVLQLMRTEPALRQTGKPLIWVQPTDNPHLPRIGLAALRGGQAFFIESCILWMAAGDDRARLVPASFELGEFHLRNDLRLSYSRKSPAEFDDASSGIIRAYDRLLTLQIEQRERGEAFELPELLKAA